MWLRLVPRKPFYETLAKIEVKKGFLSYHIRLKVFVNSGGYSLGQGTIMDHRYQGTPMYQCTRRYQGTPMY